MHENRNYTSYIDLYESGELAVRVEKLEIMLTSCRVCPHACGVNRIEGEVGTCRSGYLPIISSYCPHYGEEPALVGKGGSGTIFLGNCNLRCVYCQNHDISQDPQSQKHHEVSFAELADIMMTLQQRGCHNINFVSPSHFVPQIIKSLLIAIPKGFSLPLVYNTNSYDGLETIRLLDGIVDIYLPDIKYFDDSLALRYSKIKDYGMHSQVALKEMFRQVGLLETDSMGVARKGMIIRHLVLPDEIAGTRQALYFLSSELSRWITVSIMSQYHPVFKAHNYPEINRYITPEEYEHAIDCLEEFGMENGWTQKMKSRDYYLPNFKRKNPFTL